MNKLWTELKYCVNQIRYQYPRQVDEEKFWNTIRPLFALELGPFTYLDCLQMSYRSDIPRLWQGRVAALLFARSNRGKGTATDVFDILGYKGTDFIYE